MVPYSTLIDVSDLMNLINEGAVVVVDCRFFFEDPDAGRAAYERGHIPTAVYAHLDDDLSGPPNTDHGRHPLPPADKMVTLFERLGISSDSQVVVYDNADGAAASRLWWMLHYMGHQQAAFLDGGLPAWMAAGGDLVDGSESNQPGRFEGDPDGDKLVVMADIDDALWLVDSRAPERYRGQIEPIDPVAGHIPGAVNFYYQNNFAADGRFLGQDALKAQFDSLLEGRPAAEAVFYCGSGVTACNNVLAAKAAGLGMGRLYVGSWSEWCRVDGNPISSKDTE